MLVDRRHCWPWDILPEARDIAEMSVDTEYEVEDIDADDDILDDEARERKKLSIRLFTDQSGSVVSAGSRNVFNR